MSTISPHSVDVRVRPVTETPTQQEGENRMSTAPTTVYTPDQWDAHYLATFAGLREVHPGYCGGCSVSIHRCDEHRLNDDREGCCATCDHYETDPDQVEQALRAAEHDRERLVGYLVRFGHLIEAKRIGDCCNPPGPAWTLDYAQYWAAEALAYEKARQTNPEPGNYGTGHKCASRRRDVCCPVGDIAPCEVRTARCMTF